MEKIIFLSSDMEIAFYLMQISAFLRGMVVVIFQSRVQRRIFSPSSLADFGNGPNKSSF
jgi:hypothetical protein